MHFVSGGGAVLDPAPVALLSRPARRFFCDRAAVSFVRGQGIGLEIKAGGDQVVEGPAVEFADGV